MIPGTARMRHADLKFHRNIVRLLGWGVEEGPHETPLLVLEFAIADLHNVFANSDIKMTYGITQQLSIDVGQGLDAIHKAGIIHGKLKPQNVLVFENFSDEVPLVVKLADFGLSLGEVQASMSDVVEVSGMSTDWCAPEIEIGSEMSTSQLIKADIFSYGLLVLSVNYLKSQPPAPKDLNIALEVIRLCLDIPTSLFSLLETAMNLSLREDALQWLLEVGGILKDKSELCIFWSVISD
jgi:serine/threonine protein kinase